MSWVTSCASSALGPEGLAQREHRAGSARDRHRGPPGWAARAAFAAASTSATVDSGTRASSSPVAGSMSSSASSAALATHSPPM